MKMRVGAMVAVLSLAAASAARANLLVNGGLESTANPKMPDDLIYMSVTKNTSALPGWKIVSGAVDVVPSSYWQASQGNDSVDLIGTPGVGKISQTFATTPGTTYFLTFDFSINPEAGPFNEIPTTKQLQVSAMNGSSTLTSQIYQGTVGSRTKAGMQYTSESFEFTATGTSSTLVLAALASLDMPQGKTASQIYCGPVVDNLDLEAEVSNPAPEPASLAVLTLGSVAFLKRRRVRS